MQRLEKASNLVPTIGQNQQLIENLDRFFLICLKTNLHDIIKVNSIADKCCLIENNEEIFISIYSDLIKN